MRDVKSWWKLMKWAIVMISVRTNECKNILDPTHYLQTMLLMHFALKVILKEEKQIREEYFGNRHTVKIIVRHTLSLRSIIIKHKLLEYCLSVFKARNPSIKYVTINRMNLLKKLNLRQRHHSNRSKNRPTL